MMNIDSIAQQAFAPVAEAIDTGRIPGAALGVVTAAGERAVLWDGAAQLVPQRAALERSTWFDLASLTKVIFTTTAILRLVEQGRIALDDPLAKAIPDLRQYDLDAPERRLTFRQCLAHQTHLPAVEPLYSYGQDPATLRAFVLQRPWKAGPALYSDINFILLGIAIERLTANPLRAQTLDVGFSWAPPAAECAATEACSWRGQVLRGKVHDENAHALGGASGHAGLFGSVDATLDFAQGLLAASLLSAQSIAQIRTPQSPTRALGWERQHEGWSGGESCSPETLGHTGFTGTGLWIDWSRGLAWALLTNRVHPSRHVETGIAALRRAVGERVIKAAT
jgi:CubicO group peptidase (beta-lactamase class C family)